MGHIKAYTYYLINDTQLALHSLTIYKLIIVNFFRTKGQLDAIKQCEQQIQEAESCIRYMAIESIAEIRRNEKALLGV